MREFSGTWMRHSGDFWGGGAAMLVALPAAVAYGVTAYAALGPQYTAFGALAGLFGAIALGLLAPTFGGTDRLISAPCAPAAAVLAAFAFEFVHQGVAPPVVVLLMTVLGILSGAIQLLIGFLGVGRLIKYIPYPVVSGYLSGVGLVIIGSQLPKLMGVPDGVAWFSALLSPALWDWRALAVGGATAGVMLLAPRLTRAVPGTVLGLLAGALTYGGLAVGDPSLRTLEGNGLVIGELGASGAGYLELIAQRWREIGELRLVQVGNLVGSALTLAALLSIDTLKTSVVLDQMTRTRHDPDRELAAQGFANVVAATVGGMPGAGTMGASLVNLSSGAQTRISGIVEGALTLVAGLLLGAFVAWIPVAALGGVLIVVALRMIDTDPLRFLESRSTVLDFSVVLVVIGVALFVGLIAASAAGVVLSVVLFRREQVGGNVVRRKSLVSRRASPWSRPEDALRILEARGDAAVIYELQGSLFFGTARQLYLTLEPDLLRVDFLILDFKRVQSLDVTAAHMLKQVRDVLAEREAPLLLSSVRETLPNGRNLREFLELSGVIDESGTVLVMPSLESAIEWVEERLLGEVSRDDTQLPPLELHEIELFKGSRDDTMADLRACLEERIYLAGETIYRRGDSDANLYLLRGGEVKIMGYVGNSTRQYHIATFGRGEFFGGLAFLDHRPRGNDAVAARDCALYVLSLEKFNFLAEEHKRIAFMIVSKLARTLAIRLRHTDEELTLLQEF